MKYKKGGKYEVKWIDTFSFNGWWDDDELKKKTQEMSYLQVSVGIFAAEDKHWIVLATHENPHKSMAHWGHPDWIPKGCIKSVRKLR